MTHVHNLIHEFEISFLFGQLKTIISDELNKNCEYLTNVCDKDLDYGGFLYKYNHLKLHVSLDETCGILPVLYSRLISNNLESVFPMLNSLSYCSCA